MYISVQYLRAFAAIFVLISHVGHKLNVAGFNSIHSNFHIGSLGVDLFFIISGFIMCLTISKKKVSTSTFLKARCLRILPLYWFLTIFALVVYLVFPEKVNSSGGDTSIFSSFTLIPLGDKYLINNGWTLSFEFLFYFIFSIFLSFKLSVNLFSCLLMVFLVFIGYFTESSNYFINFITSPLLLEFCMGVLCFFIITNYSFSRKLAFLLMLLGSISLYLINHFGFINGLFERVIYGGTSMMLIFLGAVSLEKEIKKYKVFYEIGMSSYSMYLIHPFVLASSMILFKQGYINNGFILMLFMLFGSIVGGWLCYFFLEGKLTNYFKKRFLSDAR